MSLVSNVEQYYLHIYSNSQFILQHFNRRCCSESSFQVYEVNKSTAYQNDRHAFLLSSPRGLQAKTV